MNYSSGPTGLSFSRSGEQELVLHWDPEVSTEPLTADLIYDALHDGGYSSYDVDTKALEFLLVSQARLGRQPRQVTIARRRPSEIHVHITSDLLKAWLTVIPSMGYPAPTMMELEQKLREQGVVYGIKPEVLQQAVEKGSLEKTLVAEGEPPVNGKSAWFEYLQTDERPEAQQQNQGQDEKVDFRARSTVISVAENDPLMRRHPPTPGQMGRGVNDELIPAQDGRDYQLLESIGSKYCPSDPNLLIASRDGRPIRQSRTVRVDDILTLEEVDYNSGHINFKGSVVVKGSVQDGFQVRATGDIIVHGSVEDAVLESENSIMIYGSMFGRERGRLSAGANIQVTYIQSCEIDCLGDLSVFDGMFHCQTRVLGQVFAGVNGGKGQLNGGEIWAGKRITARIIGSNSSTATKIALGEDPYLRQKLRDIDHNLRYYKSELEQVVKSIIYIRTRAADKATSLSELEMRRGELLDTVNHLSDQVNEIREHLNRSRYHCELVVHDVIHAGIKLRLAEIPRAIEEDLPACRFYLEPTDNGLQVTMGTL